VSVILAESDAHLVSAVTADADLVYVDADAAGFDTAKVTDVDANAVVTTGAGAYDSAVAFAQCGAICVLSLTNRPDVAEAITILEALRLGYTPVAAVRHLDLADHADARLVGHPTFNPIHPSDAFSPCITHVRSVGSDQHVLSRTRDSDHFNALGGIHRFTDLEEDSYHLFGQTMHYSKRHDTAAIAELLEDDEGLVRLNGGPPRWAEDVDVADIERSVTREIGDPQ